MTAESDAAVPTLRFAEARDGARLAYQDFGSGPTIVTVPPMAQNVEMAWEFSRCRAMFERFASFSRWIHFDKRGTGCSDRRSHMPGIDERVDDLRAVMDAAGVDRAHLLGQSEGGPAAILFAVTYPERVQSMIIFGSGARSMSDLDGDELVEAKERFDWLAKVWGTPDSPMVDAFAPSMANDDQYREWHTRYERNSADSESLRELLEINLDIDVSEVLADVTVPTLVLHRSGDQVVPVELGRAAAAAIPGAKLVELEGNDHFGYAGDFHAWLDEVERFVTGTVSDRPAVVDRSPVRIETLGRFAVVRGAGEVSASAWGSRLARQLCKRLVAARGRPVPREELMELLWPGDPDLRRLGARLSVQLSGVRRVLDSGVVANRETVALDLGAVSTDLDEFHRAESDPAIVDAYKGEFLPEDRGEDWSRGPRDEARSLFVSAGRRLAIAAAEANDYDKAESLARRLVEADQYDDAAHRLLIDVLGRGGEHGQARQAHANWRAAMAEIDVEVDDFDALNT